MEAIRYTRDEEFKNFVRPIEDIEKEIKKPPIGLGEYTTEELIREIEYRFSQENIATGEAADLGLHSSHIT